MTMRCNVIVRGRRLCLACGCRSYLVFPCIIMCFLLLWILLFLTELSVKDCCVIEVEAVTSLLEVLLRFSKLYILRKKRSNFSPRQPRLWVALYAEKWTNCFSRKSQLFWGTEFVSKCYTVKTLSILAAEITQLAWTKSISVWIKSAGLASVWTDLQAELSNCSLCCMTICK